MQFKLIMDLPSFRSYFPSLPIEIPWLAVSKALLKWRCFITTVLLYQLDQLPVKKDSLIGLAQIVLEKSVLAIFISLLPFR